MNEFKKGIKSECILIEENVINGTRGKLILKYPNDTVQIYYKNDFPQEVLIGESKLIILEHKIRPMYKKLFKQ